MSISELLKIVYEKIGSYESFYKYLNFSVLLHLIFMKTNLIQAFKDHIKFDDYLESEQIQEILLSSPEVRYEGSLYRILVIKPGQDVGSINLSQDKSFAKGFKGIQYFIDTHAQPADHIVVFSAQGFGLDVEKMASLLKKQGHEIPDYVYREEEVVVAEAVSQIQMIFSGPSSLFPLK